MGDIKCQRCGKWFSVARTSATRKFCQQCRIERERERDKAYKLKKRAQEKKENPNSRQNKKKEKRVSQIENIVAEARKAGLSYGYYQAFKLVGRL